MYKQGKKNIDKKLKQGKTNKKRKFRLKKQKEQLKIISSYSTNKSISK